MSHRCINAFYHTGRFSGSLKKCNDVGGAIFLSLANPLSFFPLIRMLKRHTHTPRWRFNRSTLLVNWLTTGYILIVRKNIHPILLFFQFSWWVWLATNDIFSKRDDTIDFCVFPVANLSHSAGFYVVPTKLIAPEECDSAQAFRALICTNWDFKWKWKRL